MPRTTLIDPSGHLVTVRWPSDQPSNDPKEDDHHDFLTENWMDLGAASYLGFKRHGIGCVVVTERDPLDSPIHETIGRYNLLYSPAEGDWLDQQGDRLPVDWLDTRFQAYDPNEEAIVLMADPDGSLRVYTVTGTPAPPRSYELVRARQN